MKILLVSQEYPPETAHGGIGTQSYSKAKGLTKSGHKVFVISSSVDGYRHELMDGDICIIRIPGMERDLHEMTPAVQWLTNSLAVALEIHRINGQVGLDIIDFADYGAEGFVYLLNRHESNKIPTVLQLHGPLVMLAHTINWPDMESEFYRLATSMEATCFRNADRVYSSSQCSTDWCLNYYYKRLDTIPVIHTGVDTVLFSPKPSVAYTDPTILFVGRVAETKGVENLVEVVCELSWEIQDLRLRVIGNGDSGFIDKLKAKAASINRAEIVEFAGFRQKEQLPEEFHNATLFAAPSYYEGGPGFVYLEAMACGLPVIGCSGSGVEEIVKNGENGLLVPPNDNIALKDAIKKLIFNKEYAKMIGQAGRKYVVEHAENSICLNKLEAFYYSVLS
jgi:glycosyltransferase involved in cell wall biosynthesis